MTFVPPASLGPFRFPAPYNTEAIRLTNASNAPQGCEPRVYPYWSVCNNHRGRPDLYVFVQRRGLIPIVLRVNKATGQVSLLRELAWAGVSSGEGSYFSDTDLTKLYWLAGHELRTTNVETGQTETVFALTQEFGDDLWQAHSSADDSVHSATVRRRTAEGSYPKLGCVVFRQGVQRFFGVGDHDECQIDKSGRWLIVQKDDNNYIFDLDTDTMRVITNEQGAVAHLDVGDGIMVGEDDQHEPSATVLWDLTNPSAPRKLLYSTVWGPGMGHVAVRGGRALLSSNATAELIDVPLGGSDPPYLIAPGLIDGRDYDHQLRACVDPLGAYAAWVAELEGRLDLLLVQLPNVGDPPVVVRPPDPKPKPGGKLVPGSQPYPDEPTWWTAVLAEIGRAYEQKNRSFDLGMFKWSARIAYDIGIGMDKEESRRKHLAEMMAELSGGTQ